MEGDSVRACDAVQKGFAGVSHLCAGDVVQGDFVFKQLRARDERVVRERFSRANLLTVTVMDKRVPSTQGCFRGHMARVTYVLQQRQQVVRALVLAVWVVTPDVLCHFFHLHTRGMHVHKHRDTCLRTYIHTYIHACMHTYMHTCIHTYMRRQSMSASAGQA